MKCYVCGKIYEGNDCPRCKFPAVQFPNLTWEQGRKSLAATINPVRDTFLNSISVSMIAYHHRDDNGVYVLDREEEILLGKGPDIFDKELWLDREFARLADQPSVSVRLRLTVGDNTREEQVELPNLQAPELQKIGITMTEEFQIRLLLGNTSEKATRSEPVEV